MVQNDSKSLPRRFYKVLPVLLHGLLPEVHGLGLLVCLGDVLQDEPLHSNIFFSGSSLRILYSSTTVLTNLSLPHNAEITKGSRHN